MGTAVRRMPVVHCVLRACTPNETQTLLTCALASEARPAHALNPWF